MPLLSTALLVVLSVSEPVCIETETARCVIGPDGLVRAFEDAGGANYAVLDPPQPFAAVRKDAAAHPATAASLDAGRLTLEFEGAQARAVVRVEPGARHFVLEVEAVDGAGIEELTFIDVPMNLKGTQDDSFAACALALNLQTNVTEIPGPSRRLRAMCCAKFGFAGARAAILAGPLEGLRGTMKTVVAGAEAIPRTDIGGPWALDAPIARGSYLFDFGALTEQTVDAWITLVKRLGLNQIDFHTGKSLRFGDCHPDPDLFPRGRDSVKAVIDKLHAAGIAAGLHTYAFFIAKDTPYVTPVPDPRLGKDATFTLAADLTAEAGAVPVEESTAAMSTTTGFFVRNSVTLQIGDELITYAAVDKEAPFGFAQCTRGAYGTQAAAHAAGTPVHHLKECFGLFTPDADSTLLAEIAKNTADTYNACGFDMIYLDALDGEDILGGRAYSWHYGSKFVFEIARRLDKPALFEMSTFHHHLWYVRARMGAWDHPSRDHKRFIDVHVAANRAGSRMMLPMNLGWWAVKTWHPGPLAPQYEPTFPDDIEYLMGKCLGNGMGFALMGVNPGNIDKTPAYVRLAPIFRAYEDLRHSGQVPESLKAKLRAPGDEYTLETREDGAWAFRPVDYAKHKVTGLDDGSARWRVTNRFAAQPLRVRIEALTSAEAYDAAKGVVLEDFADPGAYADRAAVAGVQADLAQDRDAPKAGARSGAITASNQSAEPNGAWALLGRTFEPPLDLADKTALGLWVHGDGSGALLNVQLKSPAHTTSRGLGDHYVTLDYEGWRYYTLIEPEGARIQEYNWPYGNAYNIYRENVDYSQVAQLNLYLNNVPRGREVVCKLSPIKALPLAEIAVKNPAIAVVGQRIVFPAVIESGCYLEYDGAGVARLYGQKGALLEEVAPEGAAPVLEAGVNETAFECPAAPGPAPRARVTVITRGEPIRE